MPQAVDALPDDPETLKAMLIAEQIRSERLAQIIRELQRHRFGRRAETLSEDQLLLALEDLEQRERRAQLRKPRQAFPLSGRRRRASGARTVELCRRICRASRRLSTSRTRPALAVGASFTRLARTSARSSMSCRRTGAGRAPTQIRLPRMRGRRRPIAGPGAADRHERSQGTQENPAPPGRLTPDQMTAFCRT